MWGFDSMRIPFRLNDSESAEAKGLSTVVADRLDSCGGAKTKYYAVDGTMHNDAMVAAVVEAPLAVSTLNRLGSEEETLKIINNSISEQDSKVLCWQLWRALGLIQLKEA